MKDNPFTTARRNPRIKTVRDAIEALVDTFSGEDSADVIGAYILEQAAEEARKRMPQRQAEWDATMAHIKASQDAEKATTKPMAQHYVVFVDDRAAFSGDERQIASYLRRNIHRLNIYTIFASQDANDRSEPMTADDWLDALDEAEAMDRETPQCLKTQEV